MTETLPHPRETFDWAGDEAHERAFLDALERGRLHHAWLVIGPEGLGKATFAYRAARRLLGARPEPSLGPLGSAPDDPVCRQVLGRAHPDLMALQRDPEDGKSRRGIPVDEARALPEFFAKSPASAPYRVAIIDTADDLNNFGANAVLKTLEEPPERGVLFLISHAPGGLLATADSVRGPAGMPKFQLFFNRLADRVHAMATRRAAEGERGLILDRWAEIWDDLVVAPRDAEAINLDRADLFFTTLSRLKAIGRA
jgi:DNA polymerase-3 subunit delta'